jgi:hypothetical protein
VNLTVSPQIRILALVGLLAALGLGASMFVLGGHSSKTETTADVTTAVQQHTTPVKRTTTTAPATHASTKHHATTTPRQVAKPKPKPRSTAFHGNRVYAQLPQPLQWQLAHHKVVVVSLYNPRADVDAISVAEAHAGAVDAGAGFLLVDVLDNKVAGILTALLPGGGLLPDPGVLVYKAPGDVVIRLDGFNDRAAVAQAATNAMAGEIDMTATTDTTATVPATTGPPAAAPAATTTTP